MDSKKFFNKKDQKAKVKQEKKELKLKEAKESSDSSSDSEESEKVEEISIEVDKVKTVPIKEDGTKIDQYFSSIAFKDLNLSE